MVLRGFAVYVSFRSAFSTLRYEYLWGSDARTRIPGNL